MSGVLESPEWNWYTVLTSAQTQSYVIVVLIQAEALNHNEEWFGNLGI